MSPKEFKEQLRRAFHLQLSSGEVAALVHRFDTNQNGFIDCHEFIRAFYKISHTERIKHEQKHQRIRNLLSTREQTRREKAKRDFIAHAETPLTTPTENSRESAQKKLQLMALQYDSKQSSIQWGNMLKVFESKKMTIKHFHEIIKRQFLISFTPSELSAIHEMFKAPISSRPQSSTRKFNAHEGQEFDDLAELFPHDRDDEILRGVEAIEEASKMHHTDGTSFIYCQQFLSYFFQLSKVEKQKFTDRHLYLNRKLQSNREKYEQELVQKLVSRKETHVVYPDLPNVNLSMETTSTMFPSTSSPPKSLQESPESSLLFLEDRHESDQILKRRTTRKLSVLDTISPNRHVLKLFKQEKSLVNLYPNASEDTKVFVFALFCLFYQQLEFYS